MSKCGYWVPRILEAARAIDGRFTAAQVSGRLGERYKAPPIPREVAGMLGKLSRQGKVRRAGLMLDHSRDLTSTMQAYELAEALGGEEVGH